MVKALVGLCILLAAVVALQLVILADDGRLHCTVANPFSAKVAW